MRHKNLNSYSLLLLSLSVIIFTIVVFVIINAAPSIVLSLYCLPILCFKRNDCICVSYYTLYDVVSVVRVC